MLVTSLVTQQCSQAASACCTSPSPQQRRCLVLEAHDPTVYTPCLLDCFAVQYQAETQGSDKDKHVAMLQRKIAVLVWEKDAALATAIEVQKECASIKEDREHQGSDKDKHIAMLQRKIAVLVWEKDAALATAIEVQKECASIKEDREHQEMKLNQTISVLRESNKQLEHQTDKLQRQLESAQTNGASALRESHVTQAAERRTRMAYEQLLGTLTLTQQHADQMWADLHFARATAAEQMCQVKVKLQRAIQQEAAAMHCIKDAVHTDTALRLQLESAQGEARAATAALVAEKQNNKALTLLWRKVDMWTTQTEAGYTDGSWLHRRKLATQTVTFSTG